ncbi:hypothetical protein M0R45_000675 [Rubus argutus]|uniref:Uncharacterized protein n=1 Tax=Rubus argutus TaxID=59490 RepID=A0AAW1VNL6_RUBAR
MAVSAPLTRETQFIQSLLAIVVKGHWNQPLETKTWVLSQLSNHSPVPNYKHSLQCCWTMIHILTKHRHFKTAHHLLEKIACRDFLSSPSVVECFDSNPMMTQM